MTSEEKKTLQAIKDDTMANMAVEGFTPGFNPETYTLEQVAEDLARGERIAREWMAAKGKDKPKD